MLFNYHRVLLLILVNLLIACAEDGHNLKEDFYITLGGNERDWATKVITSGDSSYLVFGSTFSYGNGASDAYLLKLSETGDTIFTKTFGSINYEWGQSVVEGDSGNLVLLVNMRNQSEEVYSCEVIEVNSVGQIKKITQIGNNACLTAFDLIRLKNGSYMVVGSKNDCEIVNHTVLVAKLDTKLNLEWIKTYGDLFFQIGVSATQVNDGGIIIGCTAMTENGGPPNYGTIKIDINGEVLYQKVWKTVSSVQTVRVINLTNGGVLAIGSISHAGLDNQDVFMMKMNEMGDSLWSSIVDVSTTDGVTDIVELSDNRLLICGYTSKLHLGYDMTVSSINPISGAMLWQKTYGSPNNDIATSICRTPKNEILVTGHTLSPISELDVLLMKIDQSGVIRSR